jgi:hypothetical protein
MHEILYSLFVLFRILCYKIPSPRLTGYVNEFKKIVMFYNNVVSGFNKKAEHYEQLVGKGFGRKMSWYLSWFCPVTQQYKKLTRKV